MEVNPDKKKAESNKQANVIKQIMFKIARSDTAKENLLFLLSSRCQYRARHIVFAFNESQNSFREFSRTDSLKESGD